MPVDYSITAHDAHPADETARVDRGLGEANDAAAPLHEVQPLSCFAHDAAGALLGGAVGRRWGRCCELQQLWVDEPHRRCGIASALLRAFEAHARTHGCSIFYVETLSFQAPQLYERLGYRAAYEQRVYPHGIVKFLMVKQIAAPTHDRKPAAGLRGPLRLGPDDAAAYRELMLRAYDAEAEAFTSTVDERIDLPLQWWAERLREDPDPDEMVFGAFIERQLVGAAGLRFETRPKTRHKAKLFGMYVQPEQRAGGIGRALVEAVLAHARTRPATRLIQLTAVASNSPALRFYESCGFRSFGNEPLANQMDGRFFAMLHLWRPLDGEG